MKKIIALALVALIAVTAAFATRTSATDTYTITLSKEIAGELLKNKITAGFTKNAGDITGYDTGTAQTPDAGVFTWDNFTAEATSDNEVYAYCQYYLQPGANASVNLSRNEKLIGTGSNIIWTAKEQIIAKSHNGETKTGDSEAKDFNGNASMNLIADVNNGYGHVVVKLSDFKTSNLAQQVAAGNVRTDTDYKATFTLTYTDWN